MTRNALIKVLAAWVLYVLLHQAYSWAPIALFKLLGCPFESIFQHMKMAFFSYSLVNLVEAALLPERRSWSSAVMRAFSTVVYSYLVFLIWYLVPTFAGMQESVLFEVLYSNVVLVICLFCTIELERVLDRAEPTRAFSAVAFGLYLVGLLQFSYLAFAREPIDLFEPHGQRGHAHGIDVQEPAAMGTDASH